jgi:excinuclease ABC subunit A
MGEGAGRRAPPYRDAAMPTPLPDLELRGAREHNLHALDLDLPAGRWIAVTGPSGSGKTTLVFDTLVREGQRRYLGSLSARARHFLGKLGRAQLDSLRGLPATISVGRRAISASNRSTVGTLSGLLGPLRVLFAREAKDPLGQALSLSHFSFNAPQGACDACSGLGLEDHVDPELLVADPSKSIREGALRPTLKNGYTVYSQVTLEVMDTICRAHGFDVETPWESLDDTQRDVIMFGTKALKVPFGKHSIESRLKWEGITARPREEGYYRGLIPVLRETLLRNRNDNVLRYVRSIPCQVCAGSRLARAGRESVLAGHRLPELLELPARELQGELAQLPASPVWEALRSGLERRLTRLLALGLGHLSLARESTSLSGGEAQRLRLVAQLNAELSGLLIALDEPTLGLHPEGQAGMRGVLEELRQLGNTILVVEHDPDMVRHADHHLALGPGAGPEGGQLLSQGRPAPDPLGPPPLPRAEPRPSQGTIVLEGATLHGLQEADLHVELGSLNVVLGPSGAGKSSLVFQTLLPALEGKRGGPYAALHGVPEGLVVRSLDASPIGRTPRSTPATWSGLFDLVRKRFAATDEAKARGWSASRFSYNTKAKAKQDGTPSDPGRCSACEGLGVERIGLHLLADVERPCPVCRGSRYSPELLEVTLRGKSVAEVLELRVSEAVDYFADDPQILPFCQAMADLGLGYLRLGQSSTSLSRGEAQRVKLATLVGGALGPGRRRKRPPTLVVLDEPDRGLHPEDTERLLRSLESLVSTGHTLLAISHHRHLWAAADYRTEVRAGVTTRDPDLDFSRLSEPVAAREAATPPDEIVLSGVATHTLRELEVRLPRRALTVIAGVSGSGKSSLAFGTLAAESERRFAESLPFHVRRHLRRLPQPVLAGARGLSPTLVLRQGGGATLNARSTLATQTELGPLLRLIASRAGRLKEARTQLSAAHFSPDGTLGACPSCEGRGSIERCDSQLLVSHPERSLSEGALGGTRPGAFFSEPEGQHLATLAAAWQALCPVATLETPWVELSDEARRVAFEGAGDQTFEVTWEFRRGARTGEHTLSGTWDGFAALVEREARLRATRKNAALWREPLAPQPCEACAGERLRPEARAVRIGERTLPELLALSISELQRWAEARDSEGEQEPALAALLPELRERLGDLSDLGLGHLSLNRRSATLSGGELQRARLASVLRGGLTGLTLVLDEPGAGLHARDLETLCARLRALVDQGNTVVAVSHRPALIRGADHLLELGPGAGAAGGQVIASGAPETVLAGGTPTAQALSALPRSAERPPAALGEVSIRGASRHHLDLDLDLPGSGFVAVTGVSGSGKSTLVFEVLGASAAAGRPLGCAEVKGLERFAEVRSARQPLGAQEVLGALDLLPAFQALFHAQGSELPKRAFSFRSPAGRCPTCQGSGRERVALEVLADLDLICPTCAGARFRPEVLEVRWKGMSPADALALPLEELGPLLPAGKLERGVKALERAGLGHLSLGRRSRELSGGEAQRLLLAASVLGAQSPTLYLLDEPARGLHEADLARLRELLAELSERGDLIVATVQRLSLIRAADHVVDLGPESGSAGGRLVAQGRPDELSEGATAAALQAG